MSLQSADDTFLIRLIAKARTEAIEELYDRYNRLVFSVALAILGDRAVAEEVTQDVFVQVWKRAHMYRADRAKVRTWLVAITRYHAIDILRWQNSRPDASSLDLNDRISQNEVTTPDLQAGLETSLERQRVRNALAQLPEDQRQVLLLAYFRGYTHPQIAEALEQPLGTIKTRIRLGLQKLRKILSEDEPPGKSEDR